jgi:hypothetical protein
MDNFGRDLERLLKAGCFAIVALVATIIALVIKILA